MAKKKNAITPAVKARKAITSALKSLETREGRLTPGAVVKEAENSASPLHSQFEWDDGVAATRYRLEQARQLIRSVMVNVIVDRISIPVPCYVRDPRADDARIQGYRNVRHLSKESDEALETVTAEFERAASHLRRARDVASALGFASEVERLLFDVVDLSGRVKSGKQKAIIQQPAN